MRLLGTLLRVCFFVDIVSACDFVFVGCFMCRLAGKIYSSLVYCKNR
jgi:hypothetical protein